MFKFENFVEKIKNLKLNEKTQKEIWEEANSRLSYFKEKGLTEEELESRLKVILSNMLVKIKSSTAKDFEGIFIGDGGLRVRNEWEINRTLEMFHKDPIKKKELLENGKVKVINNEPVVIDIREKFVGGGTNPNYGKQLVKQRYRDILCIAKISGGDNEKRFTLRLKDDIAKTKIEIGVVAKFRASEYPRANMLFLEEGSSIEYNKRLKEEVLMGLLKKHLSKNIISIKNVEKRIEEIQNQKAEKLVVVKGELHQINTEGTDRPAIKLIEKLNFFDNSTEILDKDFEGLRPLHVKIPIERKDDFDGMPNSEIIVIGDLWKIGEDGMVGLTAYGWICPMKRPKVEPVENVKEESEKKDKKVNESEW